MFLIGKYIGQKCIHFIILTEHNYFITYYESSVAFIAQDVLRSYYMYVQYIHVNKLLTIIIVIQH